MGYQAGVRLMGDQLPCSAGRAAGVYTGYLHYTTILTVQRKVFIVGDSLASDRKPPQ